MYVKKEIPVENFNRHLSVVAKREKNTKRKKKMIFSPKSSENGIYLRFFFFVVLFISCSLAYIMILFVDSYREHAGSRTTDALAENERATRKICRTVGEFNEFPNFSQSQFARHNDPNDLVLHSLNLWVDDTRHTRLCIRAEVSRVTISSTGYCRYPRFALNFGLHSRRESFTAITCKFLRTLFSLVPPPPPLPVPLPVYHILYFISSHRWRVSFNPSLSKCIVVRTTRSSDDLLSPPSRYRLPIFDVGANV